jgi:uncharacterized protein YdcH (DUF465 family)
MPIQNHSLVNEFPEMKDRIHEMKMKDKHFARLFADYDHMEHMVQHAESGAPNVADEVLEDLKKKRLYLKDQLFGLLKSAA